MTTALHPGRLNGRRRFGRGNWTRFFPSWKMSHLQGFFHMKVGESQVFDRWRCRRRQSRGRANFLTGGAHTGFYSVPEGPEQQMDGLFCVSRLTINIISSSSGGRTNKLMVPSVIKGVDYQHPRLCPRRSLRPLTLKRMQLIAAAVHKHGFRRAASRGSALPHSLLSIGGLFLQSQFASTAALSHQPEGLFRSS